MYSTREIGALISGRGVLFFEYFSLLNEFLRINKTSTEPQTDGQTDWW